VALAQERLRIAQAQLEAGTAARFDVTRAAVDVANRKQTLIQAQNQVQVAQAALNRVMGIDVNQPVAVQDQEVPVAVETVDIPAEMAKALQARPDILQANSSILSAKKNVAFVSKENKPALAAFFSTDYTNASTVFSGSALTHTYGINMAWPIWTGGVTTARIAQAKNDVNIAADALGVTKLSIEQEVRTAALNLIEASKRVATSQENVSLAEESLRLSMIRYEEGVAIQVEVSDAETALVQARINYVSARYDYLTALAQLQRATASQPEYGRLTSAAPAAVVSQGVKK
jgi:outer membrane protein TolC